MTDQLVGSEATSRLSEHRTVATIDPSAAPTRSRRTSWLGPHVVGQDLDFDVIPANKLLDLYPVWGWGVYKSDFITAYLDPEEAVISPSFPSTTGQFQGMNPVNTVIGGGFWTAPIL